MTEPGKPGYESHSLGDYVLSVWRTGFEVIKKGSEPHLFGRPSSAQVVKSSDYGPHLIVYVDGTPHRMFEGLSYDGVSFCYKLFNRKFFT